MLESRLNNRSERLGQLLIVSRAQEYRLGQDLADIFCLQRKVIQFAPAVSSVPFALGRRGGDAVLLIQLPVEEERGAVGPW